MSFARLARGGASSALLARGGASLARLARGGASEAELVFGPQWTPLQVPVADRLFWLVPATLQPTSGSSPYNATGWVNLWGGGIGDFTVAATPSIIDPSAIHFRGDRRVEFVEADQDAFIGPGPASLYKGFHFGDAAGLSFGGTFLDNDPDNTQIMGSTCNTGLGTVGGFGRRDGSANERMHWQTNDGTGAFLLQVITGTDSFLLNTAHSFAWQGRDNSPGVGNTGVNDFRIFGDGELLVEGELPASPLPSTADPQGVFTLARRSAQASEFYEGMAFEFVCTRGEYAELFAGYLEWTRVAA